MADPKELKRAKRRLREAAKKFAWYHNEWHPNDAFKKKLIEKLYNAATYFSRLEDYYNYKEPFLPFLDK